MPAATVDHSQRICEVWANNLEEELKRIRHVIRKYNYIAMVSDGRSGPQLTCTPTLPLCIKRSCMSFSRTLSFQEW